MDTKDIANQVRGLVAAAYFERRLITWDELGQVDKLLHRLEEQIATEKKYRFEDELCEDAGCFLLDKGVWGHPIRAHSLWKS